MQYNRQASSVRYNEWIGIPENLAELELAETMTDITLRWQEGPYIKKTFFWYSRDGRNCAD